MVAPPCLRPFGEQRSFQRFVLQTPDLLCGSHKLGSPGPAETSRTFAEFHGKPPFALQRRFLHTPIPHQGSSASGHSSRELNTLANFDVFACSTVTDLSAFGL